MVKIRSRYTTLILLAVLLAVTAAAGANEWQAGETYHGFELVQQREIPEIDALALRFEHSGSGAQLVKYVTDDDNKSFCITFKTPPNGDFGVPHILEHSVLDGSRKFPVKSPFQVLARGSLNTFLNAMTSSDFTMYPVASTNTQDFFNLMDVYLDAVLHPAIHDDPRIFLQEGWRYELADADAPLELNGIVYNEMKGAFSSPTRVLDYEVNRALFPDSPYGLSSGGLPSAIPELTREQLLDFHRTLYHPGNGFITLWGNGDTLAELQFVHEQYLVEYGRPEGDVPFAEQPPFDAPRTVHAPYPIGEEEDPADKTYLALAWMASGAAEPAESLALGVLADVLVNRPGSPLRRILEDAGIGKDVSAYYDDTKQGVFQITVEGANADDEQRFVELVETTLAQLQADGLDKRLIEGVLNTSEFRLREADFGSYPKGLVYTYMGTRAWLFAGDPFLGVAYEAPLAEVRGALEGPMLEDLVQQHLLDNPHRVTAVVTPEQGLEGLQTAALEADLAEKRKKMKKKEVKRIVAQTADLLAWQSEPDTPEQLATIPMLALEDLEPETTDLPVCEYVVDDVRVMHFDHPTNGIVYLRLLFDAEVVDPELVPYLSLLTDVLRELDTESYGYGELDTELTIHTGGIGTGVATYPRVDDGSVFQPKVVVSGKALTPKLDRMLALMAEIALRTQYGDTDRLAEVLAKVEAGYEGRARSSGHRLAIGRLGSYLKPAAAYDEILGGLSFIHFLAEQTADYETGAEQLQVNLAAVAQQVFRRDGLVVGVTGSADELEAVMEQLPGLLEMLDPEPLERVGFPFEVAPRNEGLTAASQVQYVIRGGDIGAAGFPYSGRMDVLDQVLGRDYLTQQIRVQGGAYGAWASFGRSGIAYFASYRDPKLTETLDVYAGAVAYLEGFEAGGDEMTRYLIGVIADRDQPTSPSVLGRRAMSYHLKGITLDLRQAERDEILATTVADIRAMAPMIEEMLAQDVLCVYGNEEILGENAALFGELVPVLE